MSDSRVEIDQGTSGEYVDAVQVNTGSGTVQRQRITVGDAVQPEYNLVINADGSASVSGYVTVSGSVSTLNPSASVAVTNLPAVQQISGSVAVINEGGPASVSVLNPVTTVTIGNAPLPVSGSVSVIDFPATQNVAGSVSVLNPVTAEIVSGSVAVQNFPATQNVDVTAGSVGVTNFPGNFGVSGSVSVLNPSASVSVLNPVTTVTSNQGGTWSVGAYQQGNYAASITNIVPVSGSVNAIASGSVSVLGGTVVATQGSPPWSVSGSVSVLNQSAGGSASVQLLPSSSDIGYVGTWPATINVGQSTASVRAIQMTSTSVVSTNGVLVGGISTNALSVWVGGSGVASVGATGGVEVRPGSIIPFTCSNVNAIYILGSNNTDVVWWNVL